MVMGRLPLSSNVGRLAACQQNDPLRLGCVVGMRTPVRARRPVDAALAFLRAARWAAAVPAGVALIGVHVVLPVRALRIQPPNPLFERRRNGIGGVFRLHLAPLSTGR